MTKSLPISAKKFLLTVDRNGQIIELKLRPRVETRGSEILRSG